MILNKRFLRILLIAFQSFFVISWSTGSNIPFINISIILPWLATLLLALVLLPEEELPTLDVKLIVLYTSIFILMSFVSLPLILNNENLGFLNIHYLYDFNYHLEFFLKSLIAVFSFFIFNKLFSKENDLNIFFVLCAIFMSISIISLSWKYLYVFGENYIGVNTQKPMVYGKNSLAILLSIIWPFLLINQNRNLYYKAVNILFGLCLLVALFFIQSRALIIIFIMQLFLLSYFMNKKIFVAAFLSSILLLSVLTEFKGFNALTKRMASEETITLNQTIEIFSESWRAKYMAFAIEGIKDNYGMGYGVSTYRIKQAEEVSYETYERLQSHNDLLLISYEQGLISVFLLLFIFFNRMKMVIKSIRDNKDKSSFASLLSLTSLFMWLLFANFIHTIVFWLFLVINIKVLELNKIGKN